MVFYSKPAFISKDPRLIILGTLPGVVSDKADFYYADSTNKFWKLIALAFNERIPLTLAEKKIY